MRPLALDLFCGAGGASMGLHRAGFDVTGVDIRPQPRYPFRFVQADALRPPFDLSRFDFIWASPPCQAYSQMTPRQYRLKHSALIADARKILIESGQPYAIENVPAAARWLINPTMLCGSMFGLKVRRHRFLELSNIYLLVPGCQHIAAPVLITGVHRRTYESRYEYPVEACRKAADIGWMTRKELDQAIPPAYSEFIGRAVMAQLQERAA